MKSTITAIFILAIAILAGCQTEREEGQGERGVLKGGQVITQDMTGWVAVPYSTPDVKKNSEMNYAVLSAYNIVPVSLDDWVAVNPKFFETLTGLKEAVGALPADPRWYLEYKGKHVPKDKTGWVAIPESLPVIKSSKTKKDREMANIRFNQLIPKEMHGWVAIDSATLAKLVEKYMQKDVPTPASK